MQDTARRSSPVPLVRLRPWAFTGLATTSPGVVKLGRRPPVSLSLLRDELQGRGCSVVGEHAIDGRCAVVPILRAVSGIDGCAQVGIALADVLNGDIGLEARNVDARSTRVQRLPEPAGVTSAPGSHVDPSVDADNPDRHPAPQRPIGAPSRDLQLVRRNDSLHRFQRPGGSHDASSFPSRSSWPIMLTPDGRKRV
jgi:hypothetical protein